MANQIGTETSNLTTRKIELEISIAFIECEIEQAKMEYQFHRIGPEEQLAILKALGLYDLQARQLNLKQQVLDLAEA